MMGAPSAGRGGFFLACLVAVFLATAAESDKVARLTGVAECSDCKSIQGLHIAVVCQNGKEEYEAEAVGEFTEEGRFNVPLPSSLVSGDGSGLRRQCYTQLHATSKDTPCPVQRHLDHFRLVRNFNDSTNLVFGTAAGKLSFSRAACGAKFMFHWPCPVFKFPPYPKPNPKPYSNPIPPVSPKPKPPITYKPPMHKPPTKPKPPITYKPPTHKPPTYKPPTHKPPTYKPPTHKPPTYNPPTHKPPTYKKPPSYKPPTYKKPPSYKPPTYKKPPSYKPPTYKKPPSYKPPTYKSPTHKPPSYKPPTYTPKTPMYSPKTPSPTYTYPTPSPKKPYPPTTTTTPKPK